jgi:predicted PhzF superfamily epimerase YddE/YHI9
LTPSHPLDQDPDRQPAVLIEAFSAVAFAGNGAAVVLLERPMPDAWLQAVAGSLRQSETAFLLPDQGGWLLRWFTPRCEVPLCGHATLASLLALRHWGRLAPGQATWFRTRSGCLEGQLDRDDDRRGQLQLPSFRLEPAAVPGPVETLLQRHLNCAAAAFWHSALGYQVVLLPASAPLAAMASIAGELEGDLRRGLVLMQALEQRAIEAPLLPRVGDASADYQLRFFAPGLGIDEDPVTGSAHALVAPFWLERLGRQRVVGWQCSDRPGGMGCEAGSSGMIRLSGQGHLLWDGTLRAPSPACQAGLRNDGGGVLEASHSWWQLAAAPSSAPADATPS